ncbi:MAG: tRNA pseudouridine55 synthase [Bradymonadia bacterium]|jgi:tRNA pseudouridine55 synthase
MSRRRRGDDPTVNGVVVIDKPTGMSSFDVIRQLKPVFNTGRIGHSGTLDPMATGALVICLGWATRLVPYLVDSWKTYEGTIALGSATNTDDADGEVTESSDVMAQPVDIERAASLLVGEISQVPPQFSAIKVDGKRAYASARKGETVELEPRIVTVRSFDVRQASECALSFDATVSKGTYIRSLARDLGKELGTFGHLTSLRRTRNAGFTESDFVSLAEVSTDDLILPWDALRLVPGISVPDEVARRLRHGQKVPHQVDGEVGSVFKVEVDSEPGRLMGLVSILAGEEGPVLKAERIRPDVV